MTNSTLAATLINGTLFTLSWLLVVYAHSAEPSAAAGAVVTGEAREIDSGKFLYSEHHFCDPQRLQCKVHYRDRDGSTFAEKHVDYRLNSLGPSVLLHDYRNDLEYQLPASDQQGLVVDAGFDNYVRSVWDKLVADEKTGFTFQVAGFAKPFNMSALRSGKGTCNTTDLCLEIKLDSWFLGMLTDPIELVYSKNDRRLKRFRGISNIKSEDGGSLLVDIAYRYH